MTDRVVTHPDMLRSLAQYDAARNPMKNVRVDHHEEGRDARIAEALAAALRTMPECECGHCSEKFGTARAKVQAALAELRK